MQDHLEFVLRVVHGAHEFADRRVLFRREMLLHDAAEDGLAHRIGETVEVVLDADEFVGTLEKVLRAPIDADAIRGAAAGRSWADIAAQMEKILE